MATKSELVERLAKRFNGVPNFDITDAEELVDDALKVHGLAPSAEIPADKTNLVLLTHRPKYGKSHHTAHYFGLRTARNRSTNRRSASSIDSINRPSQTVRGGTGEANGRKFLYCETCR